MIIYAIGILAGFCLNLYQNRNAMEYAYSETICTAIIAGIIWPVYFGSEIYNAIRWGK